MRASVLYTAATFLIGILVCSIIGDSCTRLPNSALKNGIKLHAYIVEQYIGPVSLPRCYLLCHLDASCHSGTYNSQTQTCGKSRSRRITSWYAVANTSWISFNVSEETRNGLQCEADGDCQGADTNAVCIYKNESASSGLCMCNPHFRYYGRTGSCSIGCTQLLEKYHPNTYIQGYSLGTTMTGITSDECWDHCASYNHTGFSMRMDYPSNDSTIPVVCSCNSITHLQCGHSDPESLKLVPGDQNGDPTVVLRSQHCGRDEFLN